MQAAELFSQKHFSEVVQHEEFMLLSQTEVEKLIKCDEIQVRKQNDDRRERERESAAAARQREQGRATFF